ncbi:MAG: type VI secretion system baseplate subunit TssG, partial [Candidatus Tectomicrobia bacterium]|nr:type VI secretion system baseplate subunit TssG [Candidatus Tectomicrobia bacterium]
FLDIFNHRLVSLLYRTRKLHRVGMDLTAPEHTPMARYLFALMGLGTPGVQDRMQVHDRSLMSYTELLAKHPRTIVGLEALLTDYFQVPVSGNQLRGHWYPLDADQHTTIGLSGQNQRLGLGSVVGTRIWDQQAMFDLHLGPLTLEQFQDFLPIGQRFQPLCDLTRFYVSDEFDFEICLFLQASDMPESRLSASNGPRLGWTSWLHTTDATTQHTQIRLRPSYPKLPTAYCPLPTDNGRFTYNNRKPANDS